MTPESASTVSPMRLWTDCIDEKGLLDPRYSCDVDNSSPELRWDDVPEGSAGFVLLVQDLDARRRPREAPQATDSPSGSREALNEPFCHWTVYEIPAALRHLPAGIPPQDALPNGVRQGLNDFGKLGYAGPCPPKNDPAHRYQIRLLAIQSFPAELPNRLTCSQLMGLLEGQVLAEARLEMRYQRMLERAG